MATPADRPPLPTGTGWPDLRPATADDVLDLGPRVRPMDRTECLLASGLSPTQALMISLRRSDEAWSWWLGGKVVAVIGVGPISILGRAASPWMLGSTDVLGQARIMVRAGRALCRRWLAAYGQLQNLVHADNGPSLRWARRVGFAVGEPEPWGLWRAPFRRITMETADVR